MGELVSKLFDIGKLPSKVVFLICFVSGALLFSPTKLHEMLHTKGLVDKYGLFVGLAFVASSGLLSLNIFIWLCGRIVTPWRRRRALKKAVGDLDQGEIAVLREFFIENRRHLVFPIDEPSVAGLLSKRLIARISNIGAQGVEGALFPVAINPDLWDMVLKCPEHLGLSSGKATEAEIQSVWRERPSFKYESRV